MRRYTEKELIGFGERYLVQLERTKLREKAKSMALKTLSANHLEEYKKLFEEYLERLVREKINKKGG